MSNALWKAVETYATDHLLPPDEILDEALASAAAAGLPAIQVSPMEGKFLNLLAQIHGARTILEIGTLGGYSTIWLARALPPNGVLLTLEADPECARVAKINFERAGLGDLIALREGPALESLQKLHDEGRGPFDLFFLDADKENHDEYFQWALKFSRPGSIIIADNVVREGEILNADCTEPYIEGIRRLYDVMGAEPRVEVSVLQTVGSKGYDGFALARVIE